MKFICIDTETSGLDPRTCEIVELSYQPWENFARGAMTSETFRALGNTEHPNFVGAAKINGYTDANRSGSVALTARHIAACFAAIDAVDGVVVGANPAFDWGFLQTAAERMSVPLPKSRVRLIDVASMAVPMVAAGKVEGYSLRNLVKLVGKTQGDGAGGGHTSKQDVELTIDVFEFLCRAYVKALVTP
jgi:DNA polymerase III epsilon subunit-like protein